MAEVVKLLTIRDTGHDYTNIRHCDRKVALTANWVSDRFKSFRGKRRCIQEVACEVNVIFYFNDPVEATWFRLMSVNTKVKV